MAAPDPIQYHNSWNYYALEKAIQDNYGCDSLTIDTKFKNYGDHIHRAMIASAVLLGLAILITISGMQYQHYLSLGVAGAGTLLMLASGVSVVVAGGIYLKKIHEMKKTNVAQADFMTIKQDIPNDAQRANVKRMQRRDDCSNFWSCLFIGCMLGACLR